jgi:hypothetical protein
MSGPLFRDRFENEFPDDGVRLVLTSVRENSGGVFAELDVQAEGPAGWGHLLGPVRVNLLATPERGTLARYLGDRSPPGVPWGDLLEEAFARTVREWRTGQPVVDLADVQPRRGGHELVTGLLPRGETTVIFGDGGALKSALGLATALAVRTGMPLARGLEPTLTGEVLLLDYETTDEEQHDRLSSLACGLGLQGIPRGIHYRGQSRSLVDDIPRIRAEVARKDIVLVIVDSLLPAAGDDAKDDKVAVATMNALRSLGPEVTRLAITHITKAAASDRTGRATPYGNVMWLNLARSAWEVRLAESRREEGAAFVGLYHRKVNRGPLSPPIGLKWTFGPDQLPLAVQRTDLRDITELAARLPVGDRILALLRGGQRSTKAIADELELAEKLVRARLSDLHRAGKVVRLSDARGGEWGLTARQKATAG